MKNAVLFACMSSGADDGRKELTYEDFNSGHRHFLVEGVRSTWESAVQS